MSEARKHFEFAGRKCVEWAPETFKDHYDVALIVTDHDAVDYAALVESLDLVIDTRNATRRVEKGRERIVLA